ncbi:unnamed protein product, partial [Discosporangium mesarthrocarpum]
GQKQGVGGALLGRQSDLLSAQALFRGNIPGLTVFGRSEIQQFDRERAALMAQAHARGDGISKQRMIQEATPDILNAKGLLLYLNQSPSP